MIALTSLMLLMLASLSCIGLNVKKDRLLSFFTFVVFSAIFLHFCKDALVGNEHIFSFVWNSSPSGDIKVDIISNKYNYDLILPFFSITLLAIAQNNIFRYEERSGSYNAVLIFNLVALISLITSNNFVQLLCALFVIDVLSLFLIKDIDAFRRYILFNMIADILIFAILALINSRVDSLDIREILRYRQMGQHINFIALVGLTAVFIKMGFFAFGVGICELQNIKLHRLQNVLFLSSPISALILLLKFHMLWTTSPYFSHYFHAMCILSMAGGFCGSLIYNNYERKIICWQLMFYSILLELLCFQGFQWSGQYSVLLLQAAFLNGALYFIYYGLNRKTDILAMASQVYSNAVTLNFSLCCLTIAIADLAGTLTALYNRGNRYYIWAFAVLFVLSLSATLKQIFGKMPQQKSLSSGKKGDYANILLLTVFGLFLVYPRQWFSLPVMGFCAAFVTLCVFSPLVQFNKLYTILWLQNNNWLGTFYKYAIVKPLRLSGKLLWLLVDRLLIEKILMGFALSLTLRCLHFFRQLHNNITLGGAMILLLLGVLLWLSYSMGGGSNV